jgi:hypothetical protein
LRSRTHEARPSRKLSAALGLAISSAALIALPIPALAGSGGLDTTQTPESVPGSKATLVDGLAVPPADAPPEVVGIINAANEIAKGHGYCYGGGHERFKSTCYDCSGAASYALRGGGLIKSPMPSSGYYRWGERGKGEWLTVYTHSGHMYIVVAGLRFDTSMTTGNGPGWSKVLRTNNGEFTARHWRGL